MNFTEGKLGPLVWFSTLQCRRFGRESISYQETNWHKSFDLVHDRLIGLRGTGPRLLMNRRSSASFWLNALCIFWFRPLISPACWTTVKVSRLWTSPEMRTWATAWSTRWLNWRARRYKCWTCQHVGSSRLCMNRVRGHWQAWATAAKWRLHWGNWICHTTRWVRRTKRYLLMTGTRWAKEPARADSETRYVSFPEQLMKNPQSYRGYPTEKQNVFVVLGEFRPNFTASYRSSLGMPSHSSHTELNAFLGLPKYVYLVRTEINLVLHVQWTRLWPILIGLKYIEIH